MIELFTAPTPNGWKVSIALEELGLPYEVKSLRLDLKEQKESWFLKINPNGRIPAIIDRAAENLAVFESGAILIYLAEKTGKLLPSSGRERTEVFEWLMFQMSALGPMQGQLAVFSLYAPERIEYAISRYHRETTRIYGVLNERLATKEFLAGEHFSIADIASWPWIVGHERLGISLQDLPHLKRWLEALAERPAFQKGRKIPELSDSDEATRRATRILV